MLLRRRAGPKKEFESNKGSSNEGKATTLCIKSKDIVGIDNTRPLCRQIDRTGVFSFGWKVEKYRVELIPLSWFLPDL